MPHTPHTPSTALFRSIAVAVLFLTTIACGLLVLGAIDHGDTTVATPALYAPAVLTLIGGIALSTLLEGVARLIAAPVGESADSIPALNRLLVALNELKTALPKLLAQSAQLPAEGTPTEDPATELSSDSVAVQHLERMVKLLEEMKDVSMLDEAQRQTRRKQNSSRRKAARLDEAARFINSQDWQQADALLQLLESLHPDDEEVQACRHQLDNARIATQADGWDRLTNQVNDLLALSRYAEAVSLTMQFLERYPTHADGQQLAFRVKQEQAIYIENASSRLYEEIKSAVENRKWRTALDGIQNFLDRFPEHPRAVKIRQQVRVIQKNAEIEERHEQEERIRTLINSRQFAEAADLSEDLLQRFPDSPQAAYLTDLLPKLRERAVVSAADVVSP